MKESSEFNKEMNKCNNYDKMGIRLTQVAPISCGLGIFLGSVTG